MRQNQHDIQAPLLDRLIDKEPGVSHEPVQYRLLNISQIKGSVVRDLENLLNTRRQILPTSPQYGEVNKSLFIYGLRDFTAQNPKSVPVRQQLRHDVEKTILRFEPRLRNLTVQIETQAQNEQNFRFRITGLLVIEPISEPVTFDTYFDANRSEFTISK